MQLITKFSSRKEDLEISYSGGELIEIEKGGKSFRDIPEFINSTDEYNTSFYWLISHKGLEYLYDNYLS